MSPSTNPPPRAIAYVCNVIVDLRSGCERRMLTVDQARDLVVQLLDAIDLAALEAGVDVTSWPPLAWPSTQAAPLHLEETPAEPAARVDRVERP